MSCIQCGLFQTVNGPVQNRTVTTALREQDAVLLARARQAARDGTAKALRTQAGLRQTEVGAVCGVSPQAVTRWERGLRTPRGDGGLRYARLLRRLGLS